MLGYAAPLVDRGCGPHRSTEPLSQRFIRCPHCGQPHAFADVVCAATGLPIRQPAASSAPAPSPSHSSKHPLLGCIIDDKYIVRAVIGQGGMGTVYEAEHRTIGRRIAIKVLNAANLGRAEAAARFHREARAAGAIGHPNICEIYDVGRLGDGSPYLVMERLHGRTLAERINLEGALPFDDIVATLTQVLSALVAAHEKGIIHRDIKPDNVFLAERVGCAPVVKLLDFGISKTSRKQHMDLSLTRTGMVMGTPFYMAPEQARGEPIDHRIDLYACGVMLYEALTGRRPFMATNYNALVVQVLSSEARDPRDIRPAIPEAFVRIVYRALAKERDQRYPNAATFLQDLSRLGEELSRSPSAAAIARLAAEVRADAATLPLRRNAGEPLGSREPLEEPTLVDDEPTLAPDMASSGVAGVEPALIDDGHDTLVDPSGGLMGELWWHMRESGSLETAGPSAHETAQADVHVDQSGSYPGDTGRRRRCQRQPEPSNSRAASSPKPLAPRCASATPASSPASAAPVQRVPRPTKPPRPPEPPTTPSADVDQDAVTTLFVADALRRPASPAGLKPGTNKPPTGSVPPGRREPK